MPTDRFHLAAFFAAAVGGCGGGAPSDLPLGDLGVGDQRLAPLDLAGDLAAPPIVAAPMAWTFVDVAGAQCDDGSPTGIGVNPGDPQKLLVFFNGGGACGDYTTCYQLNTTSHGPYGAAEFSAERLATGSIFDRAAAENPFAGYTMVFVPYCTGDVHGGTKTVEYSNNGDTRTYHHVGHLNALLALDRIAATWPSATTLVVSGSSAGGYGAFFNYETFRARWPAAKAYLIDDSGPALLDAQSNDLLRGWFIDWGLVEWLIPRCPACTGGLSAFYAVLAGEHPDDRLALLSSLQDGTIRLFYLLTPADFEAALRALAAQALDPLPNFRHFFTTGTRHTMLGRPASYTSQGVGLWAWLAQMLADDPAWANLTP